CERDVQMARQKHVDPLAGELLYRFRPGTRAAERRTGVRVVERMMRHQDADDGRREFLQQIPDAMELVLPDSAAPNRERSGRVSADQGDLLVDIRRLKIVGHMTTILAKWTEKPREHVMKRHVVVAGDDIGRAHV